MSAEVKGLLHHIQTGSTENKKMTTETLQRTIFWFLTTCSHGYELNKLLHYTGV